MILKIIILIIFFQLFLECFRFREGAENEKPAEPGEATYTSFNIDFSNIGTECEIENNIKFPAYNPLEKIYTNKNNFLYNNRQNILKYATTSCP